MTIQYVDLRLSMQDNGLGTPVLIPTTPDTAMFGDIGIQTTPVLPANVELVRVQITGSVLLLFQKNQVPITVNVYKNDDPSPFYTTSSKVPSGMVVTSTLGIHAMDFPTPAEVISGQIRYTATITQEEKGDTLMSARSLSGIAFAGNG
ncbi:hypothetical protein ACFO9Q_15475 [Paenibacillus sp. GCM10023252]|uniref:hypothetical protein n=1 Tax=Paenibacillus sp. GCM10023252 TaxID=3252649 RepID=UPI0036091A6B